jgi:hypothetical protein
MKYNEGRLNDRNARLPGGTCPADWSPWMGAAPPFSAVVDGCHPSRFLYLVLYAAVRNGLRLPGAAGQVPQRGRQLQRVVRPGLRALLGRVRPDAARDEHGRSDGGPRILSLESIFCGPGRQAVILAENSSNGGKTVNP